MVRQRGHLLTYRRSDLFKIIYYTKGITLTYIITFLTYKLKHFDIFDGTENGFGQPNTMKQSSIHLQAQMKFRNDREMNKQVAVEHMT